MFLVCGGPRGRPDILLSREEGHELLLRQLRETGRGEVVVGGGLRGRQVVVESRIREPFDLVKGDLEDWRPVALELEIVVELLVGVDMLLWRRGEQWRPFALEVVNIIRAGAGKPTKRLSGLLLGVAGVLGRRVASARAFKEGVHDSILRERSVLRVDLEDGGEEVQEEVELCLLARPTANRVLEQPGSQVLPKESSLISGSA